MNKFVFLFALFIAFSASTSAQQQKPKVALVLSGGGAKGLAHIPTLQILDSLGIVPDMVVGNSMGSIVGGLYAMGYSGDSIASIAKNANWDKLIGGGVSLQNVSVEEKSEFNRYLIGLDRVNGKINYGNFLLNDQNLRIFIAGITYPAYMISDFDQLPIPFRAIATDIVNGKEVILDKGNLAYAMRASMSIPGAFSPVPYENTLLIDGGVLNNFPVDVAKELGATIIIGSDVGGGMVAKDKLDNIGSLLFQTGMLSSNLKNPGNRALCDILIDHNLTYSSGDFTKAENIYEEGKIAAYDNLDALVALSEKLKGFPQLKHSLPAVDENIILDTIVYNNISASNKALVKARTNVKLHQKYTRQDILDGINRAMGTTIFSAITIESYNDGKVQGLQLNGFERSKHQVKGSLHYDSYHGAGLIVNFTGRNIIGNASRTLLTIDVAEEPRLRLQHQKNFGTDRNWWWRSEVLGQRIEQDIFIQGENVDNMKYRYFDFSNQVNVNTNSLRSYLGIGINYQNAHLKPTVDPKFNTNIYNLNNYDLNNIEVNFHYLQNTFNKVFFATEGTIFKGYISRSLQNDVNVSFYEAPLTAIDGETNGFTKLSLDFQKRFHLLPKTAAIIGATGNFIMQDELRDGDVSFTQYGIGAKYFLGGVQEEPSKNNYVFPGLYEGELIASQFLKLNLGLQYNPVGKLFVTPHMNLATVGFADFDDFIDNPFAAKGNWNDAEETSMLLSSGATFSYHSILGPVNLDVSWVNKTDKVRVFLGIGFNLNKSD